jgi:uncharacterized protein YjcR
VARARNEKRDQAFALWKESGGSKPLKEIAQELDFPDSRIRKWKTEDKWDEKIKERSDSPKGALRLTKGSVQNKGAPKGNKNAVGHGAPKGNKNAVGNRGGLGGPFGNKKAVTTGEYENIWFDCLTEEEQLLCTTINTDTLAQVEGDIRLITLRERRMMERIRRLMSGLTEKERKVLQELHIQKTPVQFYDEKTGESKTIVMPESKLVVTEVTETEYRVIDDIVRLEEALTRVQEKKARLLALKHTIEISNIELLNEKQRLELEKLKAEISKLKGDGDGDEDEPDNFMDALQGKVTEAWGDGS